MTWIQNRLTPQVRIAWLYFLVATAWILFSDTLLYTLFTERLDDIPAVSVLKGLAFVSVTAGLLYLHLRREFGLRFRAEADLEYQIEQSRRYQKQLEISEERLRKAIEESPLPTMIFAEDGEIITLSRTWCELTGYTRAQLQSVNDWVESAYPADAQRTVTTAHIRRLFAQDERLEQGEQTITCQDGTTRIWDFTSTPLGRLSDGRRAVISIAADVTERAEIWDELQRTNQFLRTLIQASPLGITVFEPDGTVQMWNPAAEQILGWSADEAVGQPLPFVRPQDQGEFRGLVERVASGQTFTGVDVQRRRKDGTVVDLSISAGPLYDPAGNYIGVVGIMQDITERKRLEARLRESELRFRQMAENIEEVFYLYDVEQDATLYVSRAYETLWGRSRASLYQEPGSFLEAVHPDDRDRAIKSARRQRQGEPAEQVYRIIRPDRSIRWVRSRSFPVMEEDGTFHRVAGIAEDITRQVKYENQLRRLAQRLVNALDTERARIARELHDQIGQQLTGLGINLGIIQSGLSDQHPAIERLNDSADILSGIIERIRLIISDLRPPILDDMGLVAGLRWYCERFARRTGIQVTFEVTEEGLSFNETIDNTLYQIAQEALTNVAKHAQASAAWVLLSVEQTRLTLTIRDNGCGFDAQAATYSDHAASWGLQIMQERARALVGARLNIDSRPGAGTRITVEVQL